MLIGPVVMIFIGLWSLATYTIHQNAFNLKLLVQLYKKKLYYVVYYLLDREWQRAFIAPADRKNWLQKAIVGLKNHHLFTRTN